MLVTLSWQVQQEWKPFSPLPLPKVTLNTNRQLGGLGFVVCSARPRPPLPVRQLEHVSVQLSTCQTLDSLNGSSGNQLLVESDVIT